VTQIHPDRLIYRVHGERRRKRRLDNAVVWHAAIHFTDLIELDRRSIHVVTHTLVNLANNLIGGGPPSNL
jgi:hypothetical protein